MAERIDVSSLDAVGFRLYKAHGGQASLATRDTISEILKEASTKIDGHKFGRHFLLAEWEQIVDARQLEAWEEYRDVPRLGRKTRLSDTHRKTLWSIFEIVRTDLKMKDLITKAGLFTELAGIVAANKDRPYDFAVVDEAQDISIPQLRFLVALGANYRNALFFAGDLGQRIFQQPFSWKSFGVDIRGRSHTLRVNYRTSHQIRTQADRLIGPEVADGDGNREDRRDTVSVFNGPSPLIRVLMDEDEERQTVVDWISTQVTIGIPLHEIGIIVRSGAQLDRAKSAVQKLKLPVKILDERVETANGHVSICTMDLAKGLEFRVVAVMACDDEVVPLQERIEMIGDDADLQEVYDTERYLLYVACTRARDHLLITSVKPSSEFLDDLL